MVGETNTIPVKTAIPVAAQQTTPVAKAKVTIPTPEATAAATPVIGEPEQSIFKKWWLWAIIIVIIGAGTGAYFLL